MKNHRRITVIDQIGPDENPSSVAEQTREWGEVDADLIRAAISQVVGQPIRGKIILRGPGGSLRLGPSSRTVTVRLES